MDHCGQAEHRLHNHNSNLTGPSSPFLIPQQHGLKRRRTTSHPARPEAPEAAKIPEPPEEAQAAEKDEPTISKPILCSNKGEWNKAIERKHIIEFCKPGGGRLTLDFVTLGMSFIGECSDLIFLSFHQTKKQGERESFQNPALETIGGVMFQRSSWWNQAHLFSKAGSFAALGARLFRQGLSADLVGLFVNEVFDESPKLRDEILSWGTACIFRPPPERLMAKIWNKYLAMQDDQGK